MEYPGNKSKNIFIITIICFSNIWIWLGNHRQVFSWGKLQMLGAHATNKVFPNRQHWASERYRGLRIRALHTS